MEKNNILINRQVRKSFFIKNLNNFTFCFNIPLFFKVAKSGAVLYFDSENPQSYVKDRIGKMGFREEDAFKLAHFEGLKLDDEADFEAICRDVQQAAPVLVVFDTLIRFHNSDENDASAMSLVMGRLRQVANLGSCVLTQIHQNKGSGDLRVRSRGSSDIIAGCDLELSLTEDDPKKNPGLLTLRSVKARMAPVDPVTVRIQETHGHLEMVLADEMSSEVSDAVDEILEEATEPLSVTALYNRVTLQGVEASRQAVYRHLVERQQKDPGSLVVTEKGRAKYYRGRGVL